MTYSTVYNGMVGRLSEQTNIGFIGRDERSVVVVGSGGRVRLTTEVYRGALESQESHHH